MKLLTLALLSISTATTGSGRPAELEMAKIIPRETWKVWKSDNILQGGG
jgi:hypothetical protein